MLRGPDGANQSGARHLQPETRPGRFELLGPHSFDGPQLFTGSEKARYSAMNPKKTAMRGSASNKKRPTKSSDDEMMQPKKRRPNDDDDEDPSLLRSVSLSPMERPHSTRHLVDSPPLTIILSLCYDLVVVHLIQLDKDGDEGNGNDDDDIVVVVVVNMGPP